MSFRDWWRRGRVRVLRTPDVTLHWVTGLGAYPVCGASTRERTSVEWGAHISCPRCRELGLPIWLQYQLTTR